MSAFTTDWLDLREAADHRARNRDLLDRLGAHFAGHDTLHILDLGCGTGSTLRAINDRLPNEQHWTLVDHDPDLLAAARLRLHGLGFEETGSPPLRKTGVRSVIDVTLLHGDLAGDLDNLADARPDLITASALIDLVSGDWIDALAEYATSHGAVVYAALTYNGRETWSPPHADDEDVLTAFRADQRRDKGFGPALGPDGTEALATALGNRGYTVETGPSPWLLGVNERVLIDELASGIVQAMCPAIGSDTADNWLAARHQATAVEIGHVDLLAFPSP